MHTDTRAKIREVYSRGGDQYDEVRLSDPRGHMLSEHDRAIFRTLFPQRQDGMEVLEIGAGTGRFTVIALERGFSLTATDINETMLDQLRLRLRENGWEDRCRVMIQDVFNPTLEPASFDYVFSLHVVPRFLTLEDQAAALKSIAGLIKPGGRLLFNYRNRRSPYNALYKGPAITPGDVDRILAESGMRVITTRGKWIASRGVLNRLPLFMGKALLGLDRLLLRFWNTGAWDVFVVAGKDAPAAERSGSAGG